MSIVVRVDGGPPLLLCKGADSSMFQCCENGPHTAQVGGWGREGGGCGLVVCSVFVLCMCVRHFCLSAYILCSHYISYCYYNLPYDHTCSHANTICIVQGTYRRVRLYRFTHTGDGQEDPLR